MADRPAQSATYSAWVRRERRSRVGIRVAQAMILCVLLALWELLPRMGLVNPLFTSYPSALWPTFVGLMKDTPLQPGLLRHTAATVLATIIGFGAAMVVGTVLASVLWWWHSLYRVLDPYIVVANAIPKTALVPIFYLWLGPHLSVYAMSLAISLFVTILVIHGAFRDTDPNKVKLALTFGATRRQVLCKVVLPGSVPTLVATLKVTAGLSLVGVVVGEFQSASIGLGYLIQYGSQTFQMNIVMTAITMLVAVSELMYFVIGWIERSVSRHR